jgi:hypothetical protein
MKEFVIWGKENNQVEHETVLVSGEAGIKSMEHAKKTIEKLKDFGCVKMRVQVIDFDDPESVNNLFIKSIRI